MQIIKGIAIAAVLIIAGLLALIVAAYLAFRIAAAIFEQQESWKDSGSRKGRKQDRKNYILGSPEWHGVEALLPAVQILRYMPLGRTGKWRTTKRGNNNAFGDREQQAA